ncbi:HupE/UreJ family protein [Aestuariivirga litoralis]|nr:HupE/UreJ family protein [Aestuariivirga litoralis]
MAGAAEAHVGVGSTMGFTHGFMHPLSGLDHLLAMVAVGLFAARLGGKALYLVPAAFVAMMGVGGVLGINGVTVPFVEFGIAASVIVLGAAVALDFSLPTAAAMALVGFFAVFHGHAHGAEMPLAASGVTYGIGFIAATALLHVAGIALGLGIAGQKPAVLKIAGGAMAAAGLGMMAGVI